MKKQKDQSDIFLGRGKTAVAATIITVIPQVFIVIASQGKGIEYRQTNIQVFNSKEKADLALKEMEDYVKENKMNVDAKNVANASKDIKNSTELEVRKEAVYEFNKKYNVILGSWDAISFAVKNYDCH